LNLSRELQHHFVSVDREEAMDEQAFSRLAGLVYDAAVSPEGWPEALAAITHAFNGVAAHVHAHDIKTASVPFVHLHGIADDMMDRFYAHFASVDPRITAAARLSPCERLDELREITEAVMDRHEFYQDFLRPYGMRYCLAAPLLNTGRVVTAVCIQRSPAAGPPDKDECREFGHFVWHLQRATFLQLRLASYERRERSFLDALNHVAGAVFIVDRRCRALAMNARAESLLAGADGLARGTDGLRTALIAETTALHRLVRQASDHPGGLIEGGGTFRVSRPSGRRDLLGRVCPLGARAAEITTAAVPAAAVFVTDPEEALCPPGEALGRLFGLTPAETRLLGALSRGVSLERAAAELQVTLSTVRKQLRRVFAKTGTSRQSELVRLIARLPV
jgi:DNA-binding CsgD family transcriptional regulator